VEAGSATPVISVSLELTFQYSVLQLVRGFYSPNLMDVLEMFSFGSQARVRYNKHVVHCTSGLWIQASQKELTIDNSNKSPTKCNNFPVYYPDVYLQLTCFGRSTAHHQELNDCSSSLWFYLRIVVTVVLCSWSGRLITGPTTNTTRLSPRHER
jgi:hypothetical protein